MAADDVLPVGKRPVRDLPSPPRVSIVRRLSRLFVRTTPVLVWCSALLLAAWLYSGLERARDATGHVEIREVTAAPSVPGRIASVEVVTGQRVRAGDVVATLDASDLDARLRYGRARLERARTQIAAMRADFRLAIDDREAQAAARRTAYEADGRRIREELTRLAAAESVDRAELESLEPQITRLRPLVERKLTPAERLEELIQQSAVLDSRLASHTERLRATREELTAWEGLAPHAVAASDEQAHLQPYEVELEVQEARVAALELEREAHRVLAPADGVVNHVDAAAGEWRDAGGLVAVIVASRPNRVTAFVSGTQLVDLKPGSTASVHPRDRPGVAVDGRIEAVAPRVDLVPEQLRAIPTLPEWGRAVTIVLDAPVDGPPGEVYGVRFR